MERYLCCVLLERYSHSPKQCGVELPGTKFHAWPLSTKWIVHKKILQCGGQLNDKLNANPIPIQIPNGSEENFKVVDLINMQGIVWDEASLGTKYDVVDIPEDDEPLMTIVCKCSELLLIMMSL